MHGTAIRPTIIHRSIYGAIRLTGASVSIITQKTYQSVLPHSPPPLEPVELELKTYTGEKLDVRGCLKEQVDYKGQRGCIALIGGGGYRAKPAGT